MALVNDNDTINIKKKDDNDDYNVTMKIDVMSEEYGYMSKGSVKLDYMKKKEDEKEGKTSNNFNEKTTWKVPDTKASRSVPDGLVLKCSDLREAVSGIFTREKISEGTVFGPYIGMSSIHREDSYNNGYSWDIFVNSKFHHCIDGRNSSKANWMRYVNLTGSENFQNLEAFQKNHKIFYKAIKNIPSNTELLVWHADDYYQDFFQHHLSIQFKENKSLLEIMSYMKEFKGFDLVKNNINNENNNIIKNIKISVKVMKHTEKDYSNKKFKCDVCNYGTDISTNFKCHNRTHTGEKPHKCDVCDTEFTTSSTFITHICTHTGEKPYKCDVCDSEFTKSSTLISHKRIHTGEKPYKCDVCHKAFTQSNALIKHKRTHTGEKPYKCDACGKVFSDNSALIVHKRIHTREKTYKCLVCHKAFTQKINLTTHKYTHTGKKPYKCEFIKSSNLISHKRIHTGEKPYKCDMCHKAFTQNNAFLIHKRTHTGEKPYKCDACGKVFSDNSALIVHKRTHTGEKPYKCHVCHKVFTQNSHILKHKREVHKL